MFVLLDLSEKNSKSYRKRNLGNILPSSPQNVDRAKEKSNVQSLGQIVHTNYHSRFLIKGNRKLNSKQTSRK